MAHPNYTPVPPAPPVSYGNHGGHAFPFIHAPEPLDCPWLRGSFIPPRWVYAAQVVFAFVAVLSCGVVQP